MTIATEQREPEHEANLAGEIISILDISRLLALLRSAGLRASLGESSHYQGGYYIRIDSDADEQMECKMERISSEEYLARAFAFSVESVIQVSSQVSQCLSERDIQHRFEVYDGQGHLMHYLHHHWPISPIVINQPGRIDERPDIN